MGVARLLPGHPQLLCEGVPMKRLVCLLLLAMLALAPCDARAQSSDEALAALASTNFDTIRHGIEQLTLSGDPRALPIIAALQGGKLFARADQVLFIKNDDGTFVDAVTGKPARCDGERAETGADE